MCFMVLYKTLFQYITIEKFLFNLGPKVMKGFTCRGVSFIFLDYPSVSSRDGSQNHTPRHRFFLTPPKIREEADVQTDQYLCNRASWFKFAKSQKTSGKYCNFGA